MFLAVKTITRLNLGQSTKFENYRNLEKLAVIIHILQTTQNLVISPCCFAEDRKEIYKELYCAYTPLFCSSNFLFSDVAIAVVVFLESKHIDRLRYIVVVARTSLGLSTHHATNTLQELVTMSKNNLRKSTFFSRNFLFFSIILSN